MKNMMKIIPLLFCVMLAGCGRKNDEVALETGSETMQAELKFQINPDEVAYIIFDTGSDNSEDERLHEFAKSLGITTLCYLINETFRITDRDEINQLVANYNDLENNPPGAVTWSGVLSSQYYMSTNDTALADAQITMNPTSCTILSSKPKTIEKDGYFIRIIDRDPEGYFCWESLAVSGHKYAKNVLEAMRKYAPECIVKAEEFYIRPPRYTSLESVLGLEYFEND